MKFFPFLGEEISMESHEGDILYSISSYEAENEDAISLVEGEKVYVIGKKLIFLIFLLLNN